MIISDVIEINRRLLYDLWNLTDVSQPPTGLSPRLILPKMRNKSIRISEQEARFLYCSLLNNFNYFYSVETPTEKVYIQKGLKPQSASSDLSLYIYNDNAIEKVMNVEFKAHNPQIEFIAKDIEKLIKEPVKGNWFHLLKNIDGGTLPSLFNKFIESFNKYRNIVENDSLSIIFSFCVLEKKWACLNHFLYNPDKNDFSEYVKNFFDIEYTIQKSKVKVTNKGSWQIINGVV